MVKLIQLIISIISVGLAIAVMVTIKQALLINPLWQKLVSSDLQYSLLAIYFVPNI